MKVKRKIKCLYYMVERDLAESGLNICVLLWACPLGRKIGPWLSGHFGWCRNDSLQCTVKSAHILPFPSSPSMSLENINEIQSLSLPLALTLSAAVSLGAGLQRDRWPLDRCTLNKGLHSYDFWTGLCAVFPPLFWLHVIIPVATIQAA